MAILKRAGNDETNNRMSFFEIKVWDDLLSFANTHKHISIFGEGSIGKALAFYFGEAGIHFDGHIQSGDTLVEFAQSYVKGECGIILGLTDWYYSEILPALLLYVDIGDIFFIPETEKQYVKNQFTRDNIEQHFWLTIYATYHCNLNCKSCLTHSPICKPEYYDYNLLIKDMKRVKDLKLSIHRMNFSGGEPFLHPRILDMFRLVRSEFSDVPTTCFTNGSLLCKLTDNELLELAEIGVEQAITEYPVPNEQYHDNLKKYYEKAERIKLNTQIIIDESNKRFYRHPFNLSGNEPKHSFLNCHRYRNCYMLRIYNGKLWKCYNAPNADNFNQTFGANLVISNGDYVDLYSDITANDVYDFCMKRTPFCSYCKPLKDAIPWGLSERKIEEWT